MQTSRRFSQLVKHTAEQLDLHQVALYWRAKRAKRRRERSEPSVAKRRAGSREAATASDEVARGRLVPLAGIWLKVPAKTKKYQLSGGGASASAWHS